MELRGHDARKDILWVSYDVLYHIIWEEMMQEKEKTFLEHAFKKYYFEHFGMMRVPDHISEREFGFQRFDSGMIRHIQLKSISDMRLLLMREAPSDVYCSCGYYSFPTLPMKEKNWQGADLIFDIDAKDLNLDCRKDHSISVCMQCGSVSSMGPCKKCYSTRVESKSLPCKYCIAASKKEVQKLQTILTQDMGIRQDDIQVYFSGNEGFHVYAYNTQFSKTGSKERSEIVDYIMFNGAIPETFGMTKKKPKRDSLPEFGQWGWGGRFAQQMYISKTRRSKEITRLLSEGYQSFQQKLKDMSYMMGARVDPNVTMDVHRIFRLPGSLNSKSGLGKIPCEDMDSFNPYVDAVLLHNDMTKIIADCPISFKLRRKKFGPYYGEKISVPAYAAAYMICKKLAKIA